MAVELRESAALHRGGTGCGPHGNAEAVYVAEVTRILLARAWPATNNQDTTHGSFCMRHAQIDNVQELDFKISHHKLSAGHGLYAVMAQGLRGLMYLL